MCDNYEIAVTLSGVNYHIASVGVSKFKKEIFYSPKIIKSDLGCDLNYDKIAGAIDHFSFHEDGRIHATFKATNRDKKNRSKLPLHYQLGEFPGGVIPNSSSKVRHLVIDSTYQVDNKWFLQTFDNKDKFICALDQINQFSLLVLLIHESVDSLSILHLKEAEKLQVNKQYFEIQIYREWKIVAYITWQTMPRVLPQSLSLYGLSFRPGKEEQFSRHIIVPPTPLAYEHLGFGRSEILFPILIFLIMCEYI